MVEFSCDWCHQVKEPGEQWILGFAAENVGAVSSRREVTVVRSWDSERACHPFAVHFCSVEHKDNYMAALFEQKISPVSTTSMRRPAAKKVGRRRAS